jgi:hypothetical protein
MPPVRTAAIGKSRRQAAQHGGDDVQTSGGSGCCRLHESAFARDEAIAVNEGHGADARGQYQEPAALPSWWGDQGIEAGTSNT